MCVCSKICLLTCRYTYIIIDKSIYAGSMKASSTLQHIQNKKVRTTIKINDYFMLPAYILLSIIMYIYLHVSISDVCTQTYFRAHTHLFPVR